MTCEDDDILIWIQALLITRRFSIGFDWLFSSMPYGSRWKKHRVLFHQHFHADSLPTTLPVISKEVHTLLVNLTEDPDRLFHHVRRYLYL